MSADAIARLMGSHTSDPVDSSFVITVADIIHPVRDADYQECMQRINGFMYCSAGDLDLGGPVTAVARHAAESIVICASKYGMPIPDVQPSLSGGITLYWPTLYIEIWRAGSITVYDNLVLCEAKDVLECGAVITTEFKRYLHSNH